jgi:hypothetical protein
MSRMALFFRDILVAVIVTELLFFLDFLVTSGFYAWRERKIIGKARGKEIEP